MVKNHPAADTKIVPVPVAWTAGNSTDKKAMPPETTMTIGMWDVGDELAASVRSLAAGRGWKTLYEATPLTNPEVLHSGAEVPDVVVVRRAMVGVHELLARCLSMGIDLVLITEEAEPTDVARLFRMGIGDVLVPPVEPHLLNGAITSLLHRRDQFRWRREVRQRLTSLEQTVAKLAEQLHASARGPQRQELLDRLSTREQEVAEAFAKGMRTAEVAEQLAISTHTVRNHLASIYGKLDVQSQVELVALLNSGR